MKDMINMETTRRIFILVAYDGTEYHGWQYQPGKPTIEGELNRCLTDILKEPIQVIGASRTDAGVHSLGTAAVFDTTGRIPGEKVPYALNQRLPEDIRVVYGQDVRSDFHPRKCETRKTYEYRILCSPFQIPQKTRYMHWTYEQLDASAMREAGRALIGEHDFTSFCSVYSQSEAKIRTLYDVDVTTYSDIENKSTEIAIRVTGNGFLYNMVRIIAGTLMDVGRGKIKVQDMTGILESMDRECAGPTAPAKGLTLVKYEFPDEEEIFKLQ